MLESILLARSSLINHSDVLQPVVVKRLSSDDDKFSCLMDWITVRCSQIAFYESVRVSNAAASAPPVEGDSCFHPFCANKMFFV